MAGEKRRTRCHNCRDLFHVKTHKTTHKVQYHEFRMINKMIFCSRECALEKLQELEKSFPERQREYSKRLEWEK